MAFGPGISVPTITGTRVVYPVPIVAAWVVLTVASIGLGRIIRRSKFWLVRVTGTDPLGWFEFPDRERTDDTEDTEGTETYSVTDLKEQLDWEREWWRRKARFGVRSAVVAPVVEELTFRGGPLLLALTLDGYRLPLLIGGSVLWAYVHTLNPRGYRRATAPVFVGGLLCLYLWAVGLWWVAVLVHAGNNATAMALEVGREWWRRWQHPFAPGEEYTVTVDDHGPQPEAHGLYRAYTPANETLHVANVEPGETTRVRVATTVGFHGHAYPVAESRREPE
ncbi:MULTISPECIES: CPBP family intramembrane glutamic endopeptidase [Halobacteriales]|uniref:CPBP family intramembrane glutamic endopeptidase n=1 Tax=Halobacteriales TaxID=2235 RepID=UPI00109304BB|nr:MULTISPECIES: CPBP family intramembrane glutamic endopeptidase [Halobacteriales]UHH27087.1 CPBP family intramembrane metalloprotease [Halobacterium noricense]